MSRREDSFGFSGVSSFNRSFQNIRHENLNNSNSSNDTSPSQNEVCVPPPGRTPFASTSQAPSTSTGAQCSTPKNAPRTSRSLTGSSVRVVPPSASSHGSTSRSMVERMDKHTVLAVVEGRGQARGEVGIALMNLRTPNLILCQFTDTQSYLRTISKINVFRPHEILMSHNTCELSCPSQLCLQLKKEVPDSSIVPIQRRMFNEAKGLQKLNSLAADEYAPVVHSITGKYYCLAAASALLKYAELVQSIIFSSKTLKVDFQGCDQMCMIDYVTAQHLELLLNNSNSTSSHSLLGVLNNCRTPVGARLLRMNILQPSCDEKWIRMRLDSVEELVNKRDLLFGVENILGRLPVDVEHVIANLIHIPKINQPRITENRINNIIALKQILEVIPSVVTLMENSQDGYFASIRENLKQPDYAAMLDKIKSKIHDEAHYQKGAVNMKRQRCFAVKADVNPILDIARKAYCDIIDEMNNYVFALSESMSISLHLGCSNQRGYYIQLFVPAKRDVVPKLPSYCLQVKKRGCIVTFTTEFVIASNHRAQEVLKEIENLSGIVISELVISLRKDIGILFKVSEMIATLDVMISLANYAISTPRTVRPKIHSDGTAITLGRHPVLDAITEDPAVPNNVCLTSGANFMLITGPNMSGKTTYIKQVACLQVLAQIGSYVPAESATFRIANNILSRIGTGDCIEENSSSFALEMTEMTYILQNACKESLIIIDELGRATSVEEGAAMSWAMAEELLRTGAFVLFATHHLFLTTLESHFPNVMNYTLETQECKAHSDESIASSEVALPLGRLRYSHKVTRGVTEVEYYGLKLAMNSSYPPEVIANAFSFAKALTESRNALEKTPQNANRVSEQRLKHLLRDNLYLLADPANLVSNPEDLLSYLEYLQMEFHSMLCVINNVESGHSKNFEASTSPSQYEASQLQSQENRRRYHVEVGKKLRVNAGKVPSQTFQTPNDS